MRPEHIDHPPTKWIQAKRPHFNTCSVKYPPLKSITLYVLCHFLSLLTVFKFSKNHGSDILQRVTSLYIVLFEQFEQQTKSIPVSYLVLGFQKSIRPLSFTMPLYVVSASNLSQNWFYCIFRFPDLLPSKNSRGSPLHLLHHLEREQILQQTLSALMKQSHLDFTDAVKLQISNLLFNFLRLTSTPGSYSFYCIRVIRKYLCNHIRTFYSSSQTIPFLGPIWKQPYMLYSILN